MAKKTPVQRKQKKRKFIARSVKEGRIVVRNLPFKTTVESIKKFFGTCGPIQEVNLLRRPDGNLVGCGFVQFDDVHVAREAIQSCSEKRLMGRNITAELAVEQGRYIQSRPDLALEATANKDKKRKHVEEEEEYNEGEEEEENNEGEEEEDYNEGEEEEDYNEGEEEVKPDVEGDDDEETKPDVWDDDVEEKKPDILIDKEMALGSDDATTTTKPDRKKRRAESKVKTKKGRVVVRNLSFKATEDDLKKHFGAYGELVEVNLLRKPDGRMVGCAFLQYSILKQAAYAIKHASGTNFLGRPVVLDWAVPKNEYNKNKPDEDVKIKEEPLDEDEIKIENDLDEIASIKSELDSDAMSENDADEEEGDNDEGDDYGEAEDMDMEEDRKHPSSKPKEKYSSNDVSEGKTVFVKNIPFAVDNKEFKACMEQFGELEYALICYDHLTEHSKGTGFAKFKGAESTRKCLEAGTELTLYGQVLDCHKALDRETVKAKGKTDTDKKTSKDNRHLYLVKEGVVLAGSKAAENVSVTDMAKRLKVEQVKTQMLRNLNMFVSNTRLIVHNLPPTYDDRRVKEMFQANSGPGAVVTEARVMRNMADVDEKGLGRSKEMAFVRFTTQEDALTALRRINNNPNIFTVSKRPIVSFAIENRMIHKIKQQREQKSRDKNPLYSGREHQPTRSVQHRLAAKRKKRILKREMRAAKRKALAREMKAVEGKTPGEKCEARPLAKKSSGGKEVGKKGKELGKKGKELGKKVKEGGKKGKKVVKGEDGGYTGVVAEPGATRMRSGYNLKAQAALHTQTVRKDLQKRKSNKKAKLQQKIQREHITQPKQKQGSRKSQMSSREDESFNKLVDKYKSKITPAMTKTKWYNSQT